MTDFREFPDSNTRQLIDYNRFMDLTGNKIFLCLDKGVIEIAKYLLNSRGSWRTTYVKEYVGTIGYIMPTEEEFRNVENAIAEGNIDMASCDDIVAALNGIRDAVGGGSGCGCVGDGGTDVTDVNDSPSEDIPEGESFPPGFDSREEYDTYRCKAAYYILRGYIATLRNWGGLFGILGGLTLAVITGLLLLTVPPAGLMVIISALGLLVGVDIGLLASLNDIADELETNIDEIACDMFEATTTEGAAQVLRDAASDAVDSVSPSFPATFKQITDNLVSNEQCAILMTLDTTVDGLPEEDCSECGECDVVYEIWPIPCSAGGAGGPFCYGIPVILDSCVGSFFGTDRAGMVIQSWPTSTVNQRITVTDADFTGTVYVAFADEGVEGAFVEMTLAELLTFDEAASRVVITRPAPSDTTPFEVTFVALEI